MADIARLASLIVTTGDARSTPRTGSARLPETLFAVNTNVQSFTMDDVP